MMNLIRVAAIWVSIGMFCAVSGTAFGQEGESDSESTISVTLVDLADLLRADPDTITQLREAGMTEDQINRAVRASQTAGPTGHGSVATGASNLHYWRCACGLDQAATILGTYGPGHIVVFHRFHDGTVSNREAWSCEGDLGCLFWSRAQKNGTWTSTFVLDVGSWLHRITQWCS